MTAPLPALPTESSQWDQALYAFLVEKGNRSGSKRTVESYSRMLWRSFESRTPDQVTPAVVLSYAHGIGMLADPLDWLLQVLRHLVPDDWGGHGCVERMGCLIFAAVSVLALVGFIAFIVMLALVTA